MECSVDQDARALVAEYKNLVDQAEHKSPLHCELSVDDIVDLLVSQSDWTPQGAAHLVKVATDYGSFVLRNAWALSVAMGIEDGDLGL